MRLQYLRNRKRPAAIAAALIGRLLSDFSRFSARPPITRGSESDRIPGRYTTGPPYLPAQVHFSAPKSLSPARALIAAGPSPATVDFAQDSAEARGPPVPGAARAVPGGCSIPAGSRARVGVRDSTYGSGIISEIRMGKDRRVFS